MKIKNISYPHPVLGNENDIEGSYDIKFYHKLSRDRISLRANFTLTNKSLKKLIEQKKACYSLEIECRNAFYRQAFSFYDDEGTVEIKSDALRDDVVVKFFVRAAQDLPAYKLEGFHQDYDGFTFSVSQGDVLAVGGATSFIADKEFDPLKPSVSSIMEVVEGSHGTGSMVVEFYDPEKIVLRLSQEDFRRYQTLKTRQWLAPILHSSIVMPVLSEAIRMVEEGDQEAMGSHWFKRLEHILEKRNLDGEESLHSAQEILHFPIKRSFEGLEEILDGNLQDD